MKPTLWHRLDTLARHLTPFVIAVLSVLLAVVPLRVPSLGVAGPIWPLMAVFYWTLYRPDLMPAVAVFAVGILFDALSGAPLGVNTLAFLALHGLVAGQRRFFYGKPFLLIWLGFAVVAGTAMMAAWALASLWYGTPIAGQRMATQLAMTVGCFPVVSWSLFAWQRTVLRGV
ncbi:MAG: rod shape-determining protein MreD [Rhodospirillales bacterium]|nr:MAG: rod shape-determining protein MreD [Rhodospirillales bacterium]